MIELEKFKDLFLSEAHDLLNSLDTALIKFEKKPKDKEIVKELMRYAHTLKGISAEMGYGDLSNLAHSFEGMVENVKNGISSGGVATLFGVIDELRELVETSVNRTTRTEANPLVDEVGELEEVDSKNAAGVLKNPGTFHHISEVKVRTDKLDSVVDLIAELLVNNLALQESLADRETHVLTLQTNSILVKELQYHVLQLRLTPLMHVFNRFPRLVRDLSVKTKKKIEFNINGGDIELDRSILDVIGEPLVHLLRNAVDHGIKTSGNITLDAKREEDHVIVRVLDDGDGVNWEEVRKKFVQANPGGNPTQSDLENFIFTGVSTSKEITEISGRGVGLDVVKKTVTEIGGVVKVFSPPRDEESKGTEFVLTLPVSLAIIKALLIEVQGQTFAVPLSSVERLVNIGKKDIYRQADQGVIVIDEKEVPVIALSKVFKLNEDAEVNSRLAIITMQDKKRVGLLADKAISQQDIIVKPLGNTARSEGVFSAVTILGDGHPVPIVDINSIVSKL
ncbi:hypothetical protein COB52_02110 [Candidatus Kaiserbacteria bacterium]|nr:MAG: hypothetical protein COB52_02110 [Candidatus Kaiserbacteria bacterium]